MTDWRIGLTALLVVVLAGCTASSPSTRAGPSKDDQHEQTLTVDPPLTPPHYTVFGQTRRGCLSGAVGVRAFVESTPRNLCLRRGSTLFLTLSPPGAGNAWSNPVLVGDSVVSQALRRTATEIDERLHARSTGVATLRMTAAGPSGPVATVAIRIRVEPSKIH